ncbi:MAG TPA: rRNA maturation RNase YbeY [Ruminococcaceae bacterium]|nr:rRNA maturation RNase YbeY [Oscillospiraceae bacterium]
MITVRIYGTNRQKIVPVSKELRALVKRCCSETLYEEGYTGDFEVSLTFTDNAGIREVNRKYREIDRETDVLSFPMTDEGEDFTVDPETGCFMLGDIVISLEKALTQAEEYGHSFKREVAFLTVHSMLHLLGYDHERSEEEEREMFGKQDIVLEAMGLTR